ncbi:protein DCL [Cucumis melo var. makuwa]|uniref:Protein DCL n=1 Tax=Cucumis melo var. makuwa TaxID=1194695 RepID=A0A5D3D9D1_CUCMM|nr:protein DCL [Cucumis melo var. makuwa]TYK20172.1 protein DCL [Cucumis melo var. makuwa]
MAASFLFRGHPLLRLGLKRRGLCTGVVQVTRRSCCSATVASTPSDGDLTAGDNATSLVSSSEPPKYQRWDEPDYRKWKNQEEEILGDIEPIIFLTKEILHSHRYADGERLTLEDERTVVDRLLAHHPHAEDKIGCGLESIMVRSYLRLQLQFAWLILLGCIEVRADKEPNDIRFTCSSRMEGFECSCMDIMLERSKNLMK